MRGKIVNWFTVLGSGFDRKWIRWTTIKRNHGRQLGPEDSRTAQFIVAVWAP